VKDLGAEGDEGAETAQAVGDRHPRGRQPQEGGRDGGRAPVPSPPPEHEAGQDERPGAEAAPAVQFAGAGEALAAQQAEALGLLRRVIEQAPPERLRWPMYVRNVKQLLRAAEAGFDERRYGFGGILDLLRASQRDALLRLERDRQGVLRVFQGAALLRPAAAPMQDAAPAEPLRDGVDQAGAGMPASLETAADEAFAALPTEAATGTTGAPGAESVSRAEPETGAAEDAAEAAPAADARPKRRRTSASGARRTAAARKPRAAAPGNRGRRKSKDAGRAGEGD
jgi:hypothetical protein